MDIQKYHFPANLFFAVPEDTFKKFQEQRFVGVEVPSKSRGRQTNCLRRTAVAARTLETDADFL